MGTENHGVFPKQSGEWNLERRAKVISFDSATDSFAAHPCLRCGACCAHFRVAFYWREQAGVENPLGVPTDLVEEFSEFLTCMKGTNNKHHVRCSALEGKVGSAVTCSIYTLRPSPCREFSASFENGKRNPRCDEARAHYGLPCLAAADWDTNPGSCGLIATRFATHVY